MKKYDRTRHIRGSRFQHGDDDLEAVPWEDLAGKNLVVEEKVDGSQIGISFEDQRLMLQSRGHYLRGGPREIQFNLLKQWATSKTEDLYCILEDRYVMFGEWMYACHTMFYDALPHYFMEFDVYDRDTNLYLDTPSRMQLLAPLNLQSVLVLKSGKFSKLKELQSLIIRSNFVTDQRNENYVKSARAAYPEKTDEEILAKLDKNDTMEGLYVKWEEGGYVRGRYKFVRESFISSIAGQEEHWHDRPIVPNCLTPLALEKMFE